MVRGERPRPGLRVAAPRGCLHPYSPGIGPDGETAPGRDPHALRLARRQSGPPGEPGRGRLARLFWRYKASPHQAHYAVEQGRTAGIDLGAALAARGFTLNPAALLRGERDGRVAVEVYPHTIHVRLFDLTERLPYKPKARRSVDSRRNAMQRYQEHLRTLIAREAPSVLDNPDVERALAPETAAMARGAALKRLDDTLDGRLACVA